MTELDLEAIMADWDNPASMKTLPVPELVAEVRRLRVADRDSWKARAEKAEALVAGYKPLDEIVSADRDSLRAELAAYRTFDASEGHNVCDLPEGPVKKYIYAQGTELTHQLRAAEADRDALKAKLAESERYLLSDEARHLLDVLIVVRDLLRHGDYATALLRVAEAVEPREVRL